MTERELLDFIRTIQTRGCEEQATEVKAAHRGCPEKLYDTISAFSNQDQGGTFVFGLDEAQGFAKIGVYDAHDLQKKVMEYCEQMTPVVRPVFTVCDEDGLVFVSAEIPPLDIAERPCFKTARGRLQGSCKRVGDADKPMSEYEVYSYEAFRRKYRDDIRPSEGATLQSLDEALLGRYLALMRHERPNLSRTTEAQQLELTGIAREGRITLAATLLFGLYPQAYYPQLCILATCIPGIEKGSTDDFGNRFTDTKRIEGTLPDMLEAALSFVRSNMRTATRINAASGQRSDEPQYPLDAVREALLNALLHRDYSIHTEGMPILLDMYADRLEITNPGGLYGRLTVDQLGHVQPDTRNPVLVTAMEALGKTENRYSGIPTIRHAMKQHGLPEPRFEDSRRNFKVILCHAATPAVTINTANGKEMADDKNLLAFCTVARSRAEIIAYLGLSSGQYALKRYLEPLLQSGAIRLTQPDKPRSHSQRYITASE